MFSKEVLERMTKDNLLLIAKHYGLSVKSSVRKDEVKAVISKHLVDSGLVSEVEVNTSDSIRSMSDSVELEKLRLQLRREEMQMQKEKEEREMQMLMQKEKEETEYELKGRKFEKGR